MQKIIHIYKKLVRRTKLEVKHLYHDKKAARNALMFAGSLGILFSGLLVLFLFTMKIPDFSSFLERKIVNSTKIYDRTGEVLLYDIYEDVKRTNVPFSEMNQNIKDATVAIEDSEFYNHHGVRITSTVRAVLSNLTGVGIGGGGSTITQQLVKNTLLSSERGFARYIRKIKEWVLAIKIENELTKEEILEHYLNEVPYGGTIYGIEAAANTYFNKRAADLTLAEAAYLASIPQSPSVLSPYGKHKDRLEARKNLVLSRMRELGYITQEEYQAAKNEVVTFVPQANAGIKAPHFVFFIREYLEEKYGVDAVEAGGFKVFTTIDAELQEKAEQIVKEGALQNATAWGGKNAALVAIDPRTGQILAMVGSRDYFDKEIEGNYNVATALRQPGSAFKPFIYATAFNKGFTENTVLFDIPTEFHAGCDPSGKPRGSVNPDDCYMPQNYDGKFRGPMRLREALAQSINVPAVKLFYLAGTADSLNTAEMMGISTLDDPGRYGLTLVIGGGEVSLLDMTSAYSVFANSGIRNPYTGILRIEGIDGNVLEEFEPQPRQVLPKNTALLISDILSDNVARTPTFGANSPLNIPGRDVAAKTGTTNSNRDAWTVGYTPSIAVGVWVGNNNNAPMKKGGAALAGPIWNKFMNEALALLPPESFEEPDRYMDPDLKPVLRGAWQGNESFLVDSVSGKLATPETPPETVVERVVTNVHTILHWVDKNDITGPPPENPAKDPQYRNWEAAVRNWWGGSSYRYDTVTPADKPAGFDDIHTGAGQPAVSITSPRQGVVYDTDQRIQLSVRNIGPYPIQKMEVYINDVFMENLSSPFSYSFVPQNLENLRPVNELRVVFYDSIYNRGETAVLFEVKE